MTSTAWIVLWYGIISALATGLGAIPFIFIKKVGKRTMGVFSAMAAGLMAGASFGLLQEAAEMSKLKMIIGFLAGIVFIGVINLLVHYFKKKKLQVEDETEIFQRLTRQFGTNMTTTLLLIIIMTAHSAAEGIGIGTSFGGTIRFGILMSIAISIHNIPEGLAISAVMVKNGNSWFKAALWSIFTSLPQPVLAVPAYLFVTTFKPYVPIGLAFAGGAMIWLVFSEIAPESAEEIGGENAATVTTLSIAVMLLIQYFL